MSGDEVILVGSETESETTSHDGGAIAKSHRIEDRSLHFNEVSLAGSFILERTTLWASQLGGPVRAERMGIDCRFK